MLDRDYCAEAARYCKAVVSGRIIAGELTRAACQRQLADLKRARADKSWGLKFDRGRASRVCQFVERLPHVKGEEAKRRELIKLEPWQCFILTTVFGWIRKDGSRRFRKGYVEVARKNGKTSIASGIGLYMLAADGEEGSEVYALATTKEQAGIVWRIASRMVRKSPGMQRCLGVEPGAQAITVLARGATMQSCPGDPGDGANPHCAIVDEYHEHKTDCAYEAMYQGMGARSQPLMWVITTAGYNRSGPCYRERDYARKVALGKHQDDAQFCAIYTLDKDDDWTAERNWIKANPNLGISVSLEQLREACLAAQHNAAKQVTFKTKRLNIWVGAGNAWMNMLAWESNSAPELTEEQFNGRKAYIGLDLASKVDLAAMDLLIELDEGCYVRFGRYYLPKETVEAGAHSTHAHYAGWEVDGWVTLTEGNVIDFSVIKADLQSLCSKFQIEAVAYDPFQATQFATEMVGDGVPMVEVRQTVQNLSAPMRELEAWVQSGRLGHNGDPVMTWMMGNVVARLDEKDNIYPRKEVPENKIDGPVALIMAINRAMLAGPTGSVYDSRGVLTL